MKETVSKETVDKIEKLLTGEYEKLLEQKNQIIAEQRFILELLSSQLAKAENATGKEKIEYLIGSFLVL